jgi:Domain of unknown function (DUF4190)
MTDPDKPEQSPTDPSSSAPPPPPGPPPGYQYGAQPGAYPPPPPPPYGGYPYAQGAPTAPKNGIGIASLVVAIIGLLTVFGGIVLGVAAIVLGFVGRGRAKRGEATNGGIATAGIVLGFLGVIVSIVAIALSIWGFSELGGADLVDCLQRAGNDVEAQQQCEEDFTNNMEDQFSVTLTPTATP